MKRSAALVARLKECGFDDGQIAKLETYAELIQQWNKAINLVAPSTLPDLWERHILDSAQLWPLLQNHNRIANQEETPFAGDPVEIIDLGSGGGLPGIVLAIAGAQVTMVESDARKCVFLREVSRETSIQTTIINERIEKLQGLKADFVTARALAPLAQLVEWASHLLKENGAMLFLKGQHVEDEIEALPLEYRDNLQLLPSLTNPNARILVIRRST